MDWIVSMIFAGIVLLVGVPLLRALRDWARKKAEETRDNDLNILSSISNVLVWAVVVIVAIWILLGTTTASIRQVPAGHVGIVYQFQDIVGQREPGLTLIAPWQGFRVADVRIQKIRAETSCYDDSIPECMEAFSQETQDVFVIATANISVSPSDVQDLYRNIGPDYLNILVRPRLHQIFKDVTVQYGSVDIAPNREQIRLTVRDRLRIELTPYSITVNDLLLDNLDFRAEFKQSIEDKQIATQQALKEQELIKANEAKAKQVAATAQGEADRLRIEAQGQADANRLISESLTPMLIQFQSLQKLAPDLKIALIPSGEGIIIDPSSLLSGESP